MKSLPWSTRHLRVSILGMLEGVLKGRCREGRIEGPGVSILGMLEGVLKVSPETGKPCRMTCFNPWYVGGGVKSLPGQVAGVSGSKFQSLVCWRGC